MRRKRREHGVDERLELVRVRLENLVPHPLNANVMTDELKRKLASNIRASGRYPPLIARPLEDGNFQILDGHQRVDVLRELGDAPCVGRRGARPRRAQRGYTPNREKRW